MFVFLIALALVPVFCSCGIVVNTDCGPISGAVDNEHEGGGNLVVFKGIPYGVPPINERRWRESSLLSEANQCWTGTYQATTYGNWCVQKNLIDSSAPPVGSEDCLYLNVWTTNLPTDNSKPKELLPVVFFIHGGDFTSGASDYISYTPWRIAQLGNVVSISINYRLNVFGFLALRALSENDSRNVSGNYAILDQILALRWVQKNIQAFGGDPNRVTIWGQSSGGTAILALLASKLASGLFHGAISMSGSPLGVLVPLEQAEKIFLREIVGKTSCNGSSDLLKCLYQLDSADLWHASPVAWDVNPGFGWPDPTFQTVPISIIDGYALNQSFIDAFTTGNINDVPIVFGTMREEAGRSSCFTYKQDINPNDIVINDSWEQFEDFVNQKFDVFGSGFGEKVLGYYPICEFDTPQQAYDRISADVGVVCGNIYLAQEVAGKIKSPVYLYNGIHKPTIPQCILDFPYCVRYAFHAFDLFALSNDFEPIWYMSDQDLQFGENIMNAVVSIAANGKIDSPYWKALDGSSNVMVSIIDTNVTLVPNPRLEICQFWNVSGFEQYWWQN